MSRSMLSETLNHLCERSAAAVVARGRMANPALNTVLRRRLAARIGEKDALLSAPIFECARIWRQDEKRLEELSGHLLTTRLVDALDQAPAERMPRERKPYCHQMEAWQASAEGLSCMVTSGTGSGKTECFMIPMLDSLLREPSLGLLYGVRAIVIYPLNALIESQRERLDAWTHSLKDRVRYALYNGLTPEKQSQIKSTLGSAELGDRKSIRENPPSILITNVTMLEYLLLRAKDQPILERSQGLLRWIILDEAHSYVGAQAAEMALLMRRVRAAFGVTPKQVQVMATSATISDGNLTETEEKLKRFVADLAGTGEEKIRVIQGQEEELNLPAHGEDSPLRTEHLETGTESELWEWLAPHPRIQQLKRAMKSGGLRLPEISRILFDSFVRLDAAQTVVDAVAQAKDPATGRLLLPWRAHLFHRALGGLWVCVNPGCAHRDPELAVADSGWGFGAVWLAQRDQCSCGAPVFELHGCSECGAPYLVARRESGAKAYLRPLRETQGDEFVIDQEPDPEDKRVEVSDRVGLRPRSDSARDRQLSLKTGELFENGAPEGEQTIALEVVEIEQGLVCCPEAERASLQQMRYGPPFFMGNALPDVMERICPPMGAQGLPMGGRRAISFSDSRQGVARLAAKLQQDAERTLTRSFLYHVVQEKPAITKEERTRLERKFGLLSADPEEFAVDLAEIRQKLDGGVAQVQWGTLIQRFADQAELRTFCRKVWEERAWGGDVMARDPQKLAEMLLYRELFRRPRVQNNAETMGLVRLAFPDLEKRARLDVPRDLQYTGVTPDDWAGLAQVAVDFIFRENFAIWIEDDHLAHWINPRRPGRRSVYRRAAFEDVHEQHANFWPGAKPRLGRLSRFQSLLYSLIKGDPEDKADQIRVEELLDRLWSLLTATAIRDAGRGAWRLDFSKAAVMRLEHGWFCPITRRILGYSAGGFSPYGPDENRLLTRVDFPRLPCSNAGGLSKERRVEVADWCQENTEVARLRVQGMWTDLHDRIAQYPPFFRAQEHSAQIQRPVLQRYEELFKKGEINLLNCSTTMEMGVDIPNVSLVVNSNVPPSISNYRQRVGRAGRRGEAWAFGLTFCRNLPWDQVVFTDPMRYLTAAIAAPAVRLDSAPIITRHVHAALLGFFLRQQQGMDIKTSVGEFFGGTEQAESAVAEQNLANRFLEQLRDQEFIGRNREQLHSLVWGTALEGRGCQALCTETETIFERLLLSWRSEYRTLLERAASASEADVQRALENRARRMHGEFLLSELARRGFTPSYGFPVDVVSFDHLTGYSSRGEAAGQSYVYGEYRGGASRTLDIAIREYAPGAEVVIDGLVHRSEGIRPAWSAMADASHLEDLQVQWNCRRCGAFGLVRSFQDVPGSCTQCGTASIETYCTLRPAGFMGRSTPHTSYEYLRQLPYEMPQLFVHSRWQALPDPGLGRMRADREGQVVTHSSGSDGYGYAVCICCGRSESEKDNLNTPGILRDHKPLAPISVEMLALGACPGGFTQGNKIQRHIRLIHEMRTDVFELQLPQETSRAQGLALAAGLREALAKKLGIEAREVGIAAGLSCDAAQNRTVSSFLYDRTAGGGGLASRLGEYDEFKSCLERAIEVLSCPEGCQYGCSACILRPDMYFEEGAVDRFGALELARRMIAHLRVPKELQVFGGETRILGQSLCQWLDSQRTAERLQGLTIFLHGAVKDWELAGWPLIHMLVRLREHKIPATLVLAKREIAGSELQFSHKLELHRLAASVEIAMADALPLAKGNPVLAYARIAGREVGIAAADPVDAVAGPQWGVGQAKPLVIGAAEDTSRIVSIQTARLIELSAGNAKLISVHAQLDGPATGFGKRFWKLLEQADPLSMAALRNQGVAQIRYDDRYLKSPLTVKLLLEVLDMLPGRTAQTQVEIGTASLERARPSGYCAYQDFTEDRQLAGVIRLLFPGADLQLQQKLKLPHARRLEIVLANAKVLNLLLDQGFGAWRTEGIARHDFSATPDEQAKAIKESTYSVLMGQRGGMPIVLEKQ